MRAGCRRAIRGPGDGLGKRLAVGPSFVARRLAIGSILLALAAPAVAGSEDALPPDLRTRTDGIDWPGFLGPNRDSKSPETGIRRDWATDPPPLAWHVELGEGYAAPSVARGRLFYFTRVRDQARLVAVHSENGEELWRSAYRTDYEDYYGYDGGPRAAPLIDGARVYALGADGMLRCHRVLDGEVLWERDVNAEYGVQQNFFGVASAPWVEDDLLIVAVGGSPPGAQNIHSGRTEPNGTALVAFDKRTGKERYRLGDDLASYASPVVVDFAGGRRGFHFARSRLILFDPKDGRELDGFGWRARRLTSVNAANPVVVGNRVLLTESYELGAVLLEYEVASEVAPEGAPEDDRGGFRPVWQDGPRNQAIAAHWNTPVHHEGVVYVSSGEKSPNAELRAVDLKTGEVFWSQPRLARSQLLYVDGHFVVQSEVGDLLLVRATPESYQQVAHLRLAAEVDGRTVDLLRYPAWAAPVLAHGVLYVRGRGRLAALELIPPPE